MTPADEARLATWLARPDWPQIRALLVALGVAVEPLDGIIARTRRDVWKDFSSSRDHAPPLGVKPAPVTPKCWMDFPDCDGACGSYGCENR